MLITLLVSAACAMSTIGTTPFAEYPALKADLSRAPACLVEYNGQTWSITSLERTYGDAPVRLNTPDDKQIHLDLTGTLRISDVLCIPLHDLQDDPPILAYSAEVTLDVGDQLMTRSMDGALIEGHAVSIPADDDHPTGRIGLKLNAPVDAYSITGMPVIKNDSGSVVGVLLRAEGSSSSDTLFPIMPLRMADAKPHSVEDDRLEAIVNQLSQHLPTPGDGSLTVNIGGEREFGFAYMLLPDAKANAAEKATQRIVSAGYEDWRQRLGESTSYGIFEYDDSPIVQEIPTLLSKRLLRFQSMLRNEGVSIDSLEATELTAIESDASVFVTLTGEFEDAPFRITQAWVLRGAYMVELAFRQLDMHPDDQLKLINRTLDLANNVNPVTLDPLELSSDNEPANDASEDSSAINPPNDDAVNHP
ncbi:MAG: hypothetical protein AAF432_13380 [Planctomycetota bacterium]